MLYESYEIIIRGNVKYKIELGNSPHWNMVRIENIVKIDVQPHVHEQIYESRALRYCK